MDVAAEDLSKYLNVSEAKLKSKGVESVRSRGKNLRDHIDGPLRKRGYKGSLYSPCRMPWVRADQGEYGSEPAEEKLPEIPEDLLDKYASEEWRLGTRIPFEKVIEHRFEWGGVEIQMAMKGEYIKELPHIL